MTDSIGSYRGGGSSGTPGRVLRQQQKAIRQAGKKLIEIDKKYSTKALKDDIQAEHLLSNLDPKSSITVVGTTVGGIITDQEGKVILVKNYLNMRGFPKGTMESGETEIDTLFREIQEETGLHKDQLSSVTRIDEYLAFSPDMQGIKKYIFYKLTQTDPSAKLEKDKNDQTIIDVQKFDTEIILDIIGSEHQKKFRKDHKNNL
ncbi:MAG: NUDIX hydrolase [Candidatus Absconditabacterales bacterium]